MWVLLSSEREAHFIVNWALSYIEQRIESKNWFKVRDIFPGMDKVWGVSKEVNRELCGMLQTFLGKQKCEIFYTHWSIMDYVMNLL